MSVCSVHIFYIMRTSTSSSSKCFLHVVAQEHLRIHLQFNKNNVCQQTCPSQFHPWNCSSWWGVQNMNLLFMHLTLSHTSSPLGTNIFLSRKLLKTFRVFPSLNFGDNCTSKKITGEIAVRIFCSLYYCIRNKRKINKMKNCIARIICSFFNVSQCIFQFNNR